MTTTGENALIKSLRRTLNLAKGRRRPAYGQTHVSAPPDCQKPDAPADLPITHGLQLASIDARLSKLESQMTNQNRLLLIGILALVGELAKQVLKP